jgi:uncharacterized repeat protein (TIGR02543 family)
MRSAANMDCIVLVKKGVFMPKSMFRGFFFVCTVLVLSALAGCSNPALNGSAATPDSPATFTVTFDGNAGGASVSNLPAALTGLASGAKITSPTTTPTLAGKVFAGWYKETSCANVWNFDSDTVTANTTLYAKWVDSTATFTVTFNANAGSDSVTNMPASKNGISAGGKIPVPSETPVRSGYTFSGWYSDAACTTLWMFGSETVTADVTLYAKWLSGTVYTISFDTGASGWYIDPLYVEANKSVNLYAYLMNAVMAYQKTDYAYSLSGLFEDSAYKTSFSPSDTYTVTESKTFYFNMVPAYTVSFNANGGVFSDGSTVKTYKVAKGTSLNKGLQVTPTATKANFVFSCWTTDASGSTAADFTAAVTGTVTLYAKWSVLDTGLSGYWKNDASDEVLYLDASAGTGLCFTSSLILRLTISESQLTTATIDSTGNISSTDTSTVFYTSPQTCSYRYANGVLTLNGSVTFSRPSATKTPGGSFSAGTYYGKSCFFNVSPDGSLAIRASDGSADFFTGKWCYVDTYFYVLNADSYVVAKYSASSMDAVSTGSQGGSYYYNYTGSTPSGFDAYSLRLDSDGSYKLYLWNQTVNGTWKSSSQYLFLSNGAGGYTSNFLSLSGTTLTINGVPVEQSSSKGTVGTFVSDPALVGTWSLSAGSVVMSVTFTADGKMRSFSSIAGKETTDEDSYCVVDATVWYSSLTGFIGKPYSSAYSISGSELTFRGYPLTKQ